MSAAEMLSDDDLTPDMIAELREIEARSKARLVLDEREQETISADLVSMIRRCAGQAVEPVSVPRCAGGCDTAVRRRLDVCTECIDRDRKALRRMALGEAFASIAAMGSTASFEDGPLDWCRTGNPKYVEATAQALDTAKARQDQRAAKMIVDAFWVRGVGNVLLLGPTRIGKTMATIAVAHRILDRALAGELDRSAFAFAAGMRFVSGVALGRAREETRRGDRPVGYDVATRASLLFLDDIGYEGDPETIRDLIFDRSNGSGRFTIMTSGKTEREFEARYKLPVLNRIKEKGVVLDLHHRIG